LIDAFQAPHRAVAGSVTLVLLVVTVILAQRQRRRYEHWRWFHRAVAAALAVLVTWHVIGLDRLVNVWAWLTFFSLLAAAGLWMLVQRARRGEKFTVTDIRAETPTVSTVTIAPTRNEPLPFDAGQFAWVRLKAWPWSEDHPFTISSPADGHPELEFTFRHLGDWTTGPMARLRPGRQVWVDGPHGAMTLSAADDAPGIVMVAAGVGLTPIISVLRTLAHRQDRRPVKLFLPPTEPLFADELRELMSELQLTVHPVLTRPVTAARVGDLLPAFPERARWTYFVCGPPLLVIDASLMLAELGVPPGQVLTEQFEMA
jgi:predicted ferric reductase